MPLPSGLIALLMTDVEASTQGWNTSPQKMSAAVTALRRRHQFDRCSPRRIGGEGTR